MLGEWLILGLAGEEGALKEQGFGKMEANLWLSLCVFVSVAVSFSFSVSVSVLVCMSPFCLNCASSSVCLCLAKQNKRGAVTWLRREEGFVVDEGLGPLHEEGDVLIRRQRRRLLVFFVVLPVVLIL